MRALDDPARAHKPIVALDTFAGDAVFDVAVLEVRVASCVIAPLVRMLLAEPAARPAMFALK